MKRSYASGATAKLTSGIYALSRPLPGEIGTRHARRRQAGGSQAAGTKGASGCLIIPTPQDECANWDEARRGILRGGRIPVVTFTYSIPPFPVLTTYDYSTQTGIYLDVPRTSSIRVSAALRKTDPIDEPPELSVVACIGLVPPPSDIGSDIRFGGFGCKPLRSGGRRTQLTTEFEDSVWKKRGFERGRYMFFVHLRGTDGLAPLDGPTEALVESISYEATAIRR